MDTKTQKRGPAKQVRIRTKTTDRVERILVEEIGRRKQALDAIDIYDELLEEVLPKWESKLGIDPNQGKP